MTGRERLMKTLNMEKVGGQVPHFEISMFLTMESLGRVHPKHRNYAQWNQMSLREKQLTLEDMADYIGSVPQEIPSMFTYRLPRIYYRNGAPVQVIDHRLWPAEPILEAKEIS